VPLLEAGKELGVEGKAARKLAARLEAAEDAVGRHPLAPVADLRQRLAALQRKQALEQVGGRRGGGLLWPVARHAAALMIPHLMRSDGE
jgi:hypothetical protein